MKANLILFLLLIVAVGCKTTREYTSMKTQVSESVQNNIRKATDSFDKVDVKSNRNEQSIDRDSLVFNETVVELSKPDSTGSQYPVRVTYREATQVKQTEKQSTAVRDSAAITASSEQLSDNSAVQTDTTIDEETTKKTKSTTWFPMLIWLIPIVMVFFVLMRFGAFTKLGGAIVRLVRFISI